MPSGKLPDLPGSTEDDLKSNQFHPFFRKTPKEFWEAAEISHTELKEPVKCEHYFEYTEGGVECKKCHFGLLGSIKLIEGKIKGN